MRIGSPKMFILYENNLYVDYMDLISVFSTFTKCHLAHKFNMNIIPIFAIVCNLVRLCIFAFLT